MFTFQTTDSTVRSFVETAEKMLSESLKRLRNLNESNGKHNVPNGSVLRIQLFNIRSFVFLNIFIPVDSCTLYYKSRFTRTPKKLIFQGRMRSLIAISQVGVDSVRADWSQNFTENAGYHQFEWAIGTDKGESDILDFRRVGSNRSAQVSGLNLHGLKECYITLRAFKKNGCSSEVSVKAHALGCQQCVHSRLVVGDGFVSIRRGKCIRMFFEHAEEVEEEEVIEASLLFD